MTNGTGFWTDAARFLLRQGNSIFKRLPSPLHGWWIYRRRRFGLPLNGQTVRGDMLRSVIHAYGIERIIETGTSYGETTSWFAEFGIPTVSAEIVPEIAWAAKFHLRQYLHVDIHHTDSIKLLRELAGRSDAGTIRTLFYLDAHWWDDLPLREEFEIVVNGFRDPVIVIDDFEVPGDFGYGFDDYGPTKRLNFEYLKSSIPPDMILYAPAIPSTEETGPKRGCVLMVAAPELVRIADALPVLRRWPENYGPTN